jgi:predicted permease
VVRALPLATTIGDWGLDIDGYVETPGNNAKGDWQIMTDGAFEAMGMRLVRGRWFTAADTSASQPVMVVNETMARTYWPNGEAIGGQVTVGGGGMNVDQPRPVVVGIVADERHNGVTSAVKEKFYVPHSQWHLVTNGNLIRNAFVVVRMPGSPMTAAAPVRAIVREMDPALPVAAVRPMTDVVGTALATPRLTGFLLGTFAAIASALAVVGLYGVLSYLVARRTHEIGIRMAMGADRGEVLRMIVRRGVALAVLGVVVGLAAALALSRVVRGLLYDVAPTDPVTFVVVPLALLMVAAVASLVPALRAVRVSPLVALRSE